MSFYEILSKYYDVIFPVNRQSLLFLQERISDGPLLDIAAGTGNHAIALAKLDYQVTATDLDPHMVENIMKKGLEAKVPVTAKQLAMEELDLLKGENTFETVICLGNSLVHLQNLESVRQFIKTVYDLLGDKGKLFIQIVNYDFILSEKVTELPPINREPENISFYRSYTHQANRIIFKGKLFVDGVSYENETMLLPITSSELEKVLGEAGFQSIIKYGSYKGEPFDLHSPAIIIEAQK